MLFGSVPTNEGEFLDRYAEALYFIEYVSQAIAAELGQVLAGEEDDSA